MTLSTQISNTYQVFLGTYVGKRTAASESIMAKEAIPYGSVTKVTVKYTVGNRGFIGATTGLTA
jgi:hypothetical protein